MVSLTRSGGAVQRTRKKIADQLIEEAERARKSPYGKHPEISVMTHAAALLYAARLAGPWPEEARPEQPQAEEAS